MFFKSKSEAPAPLAQAQPPRRTLGSRPNEAAVPANEVYEARSSVAPAVRSSQIQDVERSSGDETLFGGLRFCPKEIETQRDLTEVSFAAIVNEDIKLASFLYSRFAVVRSNATDKTAIIFAVKGIVTSDDVVALQKLLEKSSWKVDNDKPYQAYWLSSTLVTSLSQKTLTIENLSAERDIAKSPEKTALMSAFTDIIAWAYVNNADDIDFAVDVQSPKSQIAFKIGGKYVRPEKFLQPTLTVTQMLGVAWQKSGGGMGTTFETRVEQQGQVTLDLPTGQGITKETRVRLRWSGLPNDKGTVVTMRLQRLGESAKIRSLEDAGYLSYFLDVLHRVIHSEGGMCTFAGVVGSGKSTSLVALLSLLPHTLKIQSIEDPVELDLPFAYQKTVTRDLASTGADPAFAAAVRGLYRSAMDVLYLGEIRDPETGLVARSVSESGHSVYTTTHAKSALGVFDRYASPAIGIPRDVLATPDIVKLNVYQALLPVSCPHCKKTPDDYAKAMKLSGDKLSRHNEYFERLYRLYAIAPEQFRLRDPHGCDHCRRTDIPELNGYKGRTVVCEMIEPDEQMLEYVLEGKNVELARYWRSWAAEDIMSPDMRGRTTMECAVHKAGLGLIDPYEIEQRFHRFETEETKRATAQRFAQSRGVA